MATNAGPCKPTSGGTCGSPRSDRYRLPGCRHKRRPTLFAAACEHGAAARVKAHREAFEAVTSPVALVTLARQIHATERAAGHVSLLGQLLAGAPTPPALATAATSGLRLWVDEVEKVLHRVLDPGPLRDLVDVRGLAQVVSASFIGLELHDGVDPGATDHAFDALERFAATMDVLSDLGPLEERVVRRRLRRRSES